MGRHSGYSHPILLPFPLCGAGSPDPTHREPTTREHGCAAVRESSYFRAPPPQFLARVYRSAGSLLAWLLILRTNVSRLYRHLREKTRPLTPKSGSFWGFDSLFGHECFAVLHLFGGHFVGHASCVASWHRPKDQKDGGSTLTGCLL